MRRIVNYKCSPQIKGVSSPWNTVNAISPPASTIENREDTLLGANDGLLACSYRYDAQQLILLVFRLRKWYCFGRPYIYN